MKASSTSSHGDQRVGGLNERIHRSGSAVRGVPRVDVLGTVLAVDDEIPLANVIASYFTREAYEVR